MTLGPAVPFFIVSHLGDALDYYRKALGFRAITVTPPEEPFFAIVERDAARFMLKQIAPEVMPSPNHTGHQWARWDAFVAVDDPDALALELERRNATFHAPLADTDDGLRAFEVRDRDGYVICFGRTLD